MAWDPYKKYQIEQLEKIYKRAARFVTGNHKREHGNTNKNMTILGWPPLLERRSKIKLTMLYKIKSDLAHIPREDLRQNPRKKKTTLFLLLLLTLTSFPSSQVLFAYGILPLSNLKIVLH